MLRRQMVNPQVRTAEQIAATPFEAVYPQTEGVSSSLIAKCVRQLLPHAELLPDPLPEEMRKKYRLLSKRMRCGPSTARKARTLLSQHGGGSSTKSCWCCSSASAG